MDNYNPNIFEDEAEYMMQADPRGGSYRPVYIENGVYSNHIDRFVVFAESITVIKYDDLIEHPEVTLDGLCLTLNIDPFESVEFPHENYATDDGWFKNETVDRMTEFYFEHDARMMEKML
jgi:hypothetical protein